MKASKAFDIIQASDGRMYFEDSYETDGFENKEEAEAQLKKWDAADEMIEILKDINSAVVDHRIENLLKSLEDETDKT